MKKYVFLLFCLLPLFGWGQLTADNKFARPLGEVLDEISQRFGVRLKTSDVIIEGKMLDYADFRIRPYSLEESLNNVLAPFDYKFVKQNDKFYKIKPYEYARRTEADGEKMLAYLTGLYADTTAWHKRKACLKEEIAEKLGIRAPLKARVPLKPILSKERRYDGYAVQNIAIETLPGIYVCGTIYKPRTKGKHPVMICPNGHFFDGRYRKSQQQRCATLARMGVICVGYDLFGWGESELQVPYAAHRLSMAHVMQTLNGITMLDYLLSRPDADPARVGVTGGSGGGSQTMLLTALDDRITASAPVVMVSSYFNGGCPCESGMPIHLACGGTCNAEIAAMAAPRPLLIVSDGKDWTAAVPQLEYPFIRRIYDFYGAAGLVKNAHFAEEGHDYLENKRRAVYDFFAECFHLDTSKVKVAGGIYPETDITIESKEDMYSFGPQGEYLPANAVRSLEQAEDVFREAYR